MEPQVFRGVADSVLDSLREGCQVIGFDWTYVYVNSAVVRHGQKPRDELLGRTMMACYPGIEQTAMFAKLSQCMTARTYDRMENRFTLPDGSEGTFELRFVPVPEGVCVLSMDVTDDMRQRAMLARAEEQLRHATKMEAVGRLAGGVAHDFNNILSVILSYGDMMLSELGLDEPMRPDVEAIVSAGRRAAELTKQLLAFSRQQVLSLRVVDLNEVLVGMDKLLQRILGADVDLVSLHEKHLGRVRVDPSSIEQVLMNLAVNARDAMPTGGKLTMETRNVYLDENYAREHLEVTPGWHVMLAVTDSGVGMEKATLARIFEPFFTTKESGKGTGLGLSIVFGIVRQSGGHVWVYSEPEKGTTFKVYLPRVEMDLQDQPPQPAPGPARGTETILLVEDDQAVRTVAREILRKAGYQVLEARNAGEALLSVEQHPAGIDLLLTDVVMPQMSGPELAKRLTLLRPQMKVLCMSGYTDDSIVRHGVLDSRIAYLQKPITPDMLLSKLREVLEDRANDDASRGH